MNPFIKELKSWSDFKGKTNRKDFWIFNGLILSVYLIISLLVLLFWEHRVLVGIVALTYWLVTLIPVMSSIVRRLHDMGSTGLVALIYFAPYIGQLLLYIILLGKSKEFQLQV